LLLFPFGEQFIPGSSLPVTDPGAFLDTSLRFLVLRTRFFFCEFFFFCCAVICFEMK
jgi:hypothetical protein